MKKELFFLVVSISLLFLFSCKHSMENESEKLVLQGYGLVNFDIPSKFTVDFSQINAFCYAKIGPPNTEFDLEIDWFSIRAPSGIKAFDYENDEIFNSNGADCSILDNHNEYFSPILEVSENHFLEEIELSSSKARSYLIRVRDDRFIFMVPMSIWIGGLDRYQFIWGLYTR